MDVLESSLKFGLMLEAYLRGSVNHIPELRQQMDGIGKMRSISELLHSKGLKDRDKKEKARDTMQQVLAQQSYKQVLNNCVSTLDPKLTLGGLKDQECRFYDSKMRPLLMVYENPDPSASPSDIRVIFKNGDGKGLCFYLHVHVRNVHCACMGTP
ncbi:PREDICTED: phosphatidylinositol 4,5-bisphosphate 3-kinase catalytic subunit beta isoform-like [Amphimedon queenslandica]|uniref:Uncharacterized protein n=1 Tax=Amphimedon queenslandica TaxID=400682 RepID=A0AAN0JTC8_AMPQE|nr:PREDICTED: phosphatidylinositol 4,5-bisphosphate 3-kinase catalytic subunit beta isoform-like [Amphimedon queenslandica]|eukprot:XP_019860157.1 PREDICTED: phosphatidylinositol 4,5-bisphosphate 3-kinase catalytic subunit beta isoform-like [Amphimedon queenslandica]